MRSRFCYALAVLAACDGSPLKPADTADHGFLLVSRDALNAPSRLEDGTPIGVMPLALEDRPYMLAQGERRVAIDTGESLLTYASGADAHELWVIGGDVYGDRVAIEGAQPAVARIASELGASVEASGDGRWILRGEDLWPRAAELEPTGVIEVIPILITNDGRGEIAGSAATARNPQQPAPSGPVPELGPARVAVTESKTSKGVCADPGVGSWVARTHRTESGDWHEFTLQLARTPRGVQGTLDVKFWSGDADDPSIGSCDDGSPAAGAGTMSAKGVWKGNRLKLDATRLRSIRGVCGEEVDYHLDHFTGTLRSDGAVAAKNTDYHAALARPYVFERVSCSP